MSLIVNADDFGRDAAYNAAIVESFRRRWINQTTIMVNMSGFEEAVRLAKENGFWDRVGLHLNLTEGRPLTDECAKSVFCEQGTFNDMRSGRKLFGSYDKKTEAALRREIQAQIARYLDEGFTLRHCDSHSHMHTRLPIAKILFPELERAGFKTVRRPYNYLLGWRMGAILRRVRNAFFVISARWHGLQMTKWFSAPVPDGEFMVHPRFREDGEIIDKRDFVRGTGPLMRDVATKIHSMMVR